MTDYKCWCSTCDDEQRQKGEIGLMDIRMNLCPECGNKRCPRATYHEHQCTNSNEPNQEGSAY